MAKSFRVTLVAVACIALLGFVIKPSFIRARAESQQNSCNNYQLQINNAKEHWRIEFHKASNDVPTWNDLTRGQRYLRSVPHCPAGGTYVIGRLDEWPRCSISTHKLEDTP